MPPLRRVASALAILFTAVGWVPLRRHVATALVRPAAPIPPARPRGALRVVTWNLRNFPAGHDVPRMRRALHELEPQVIALQEVVSPLALDTLLPGYARVASNGGGRHGQHVALAWDPDRLSLVHHDEHSELSLGGLVRPALSVRLREADGEPVTFVVVHLKATRSGYLDRREQWPLLSAVVDRVAPPPHDVVVLGDFNVAGGEDVPASREHDQLRAALGATALVAWPSETGCTSYWEGHRRDGWQVPSTLDLVWSRGPRTDAARSPRAWSGAHCARHRCEPLRSTDAYPDMDVSGASDHCPVVIDLPAR